MERGDENRSRRRHSVTTWLLFFFLLFLVTILVAPPLVNIGRYKRRIADIVSRSVDRPVRIADVKLHLLPRPGFELSDFVVNEDPAFGAEPVLRSASVTASIRLSSLWRGRLEIARISLDEPSVNLVRNAQGRWNLSAMIVQAARLPTAPTGQRHASGALRFPYIEANGARINFKFGDEKQPFSFVNTDFSAWLENPNEWRLRMEGQPVRTDLDLDLSDTGIVRMEGSLRRASSLAQMPVRLDADWSDVQVGQMARLLMGADTAWRGAVHIRATVTGTMEQAQLKAHVRVANVHRLEFAPLQAVNLDTTCEGRYVRPTESLEGLACLSAVGDGHALLTGAVETLHHPEPRLALDLEKVPASVLLDALRLVRKGFAPSTQLSGTLNGHLTYARGTANAASLQGGLTVTALSLNAPGFSKPLTVPALRLATIVSGAPAVRRRVRAMVAAPPATAPPSGLIFEPASVALGGAQPLILDGRFSHTGFDLHMTGQAAISSLLALSQDFGFLRTALGSLGSRGTAEMDFTLHGPWLATLGEEGQPVSTTTARGTIRLRNALINTRILSNPIEVSSAQASFADGQASWNAVSADYGEIHAEGSFSYPLMCPPAGCMHRFDLRTSALDAVAVQSALTGGHGELMEAILSRLDRHVAWPLLTGTVRAGSLSLGEFAVQDAVAVLTIEANQLEIHSLDGHALGGQLHLTGTVDAKGDAPHYALEAECTRADPADLSKVFHEKWGSGMLNLSAKLELTGMAAADLAASAHGTFQWDWTHGSLPVDADAPSPLARFERWQAEGHVEARALHLESGSLRSGNATFPLLGTISFAREVSLRSGREDAPWSVDGTLEHVHLEEDKGAEPSRAALKER